MNEILIILQLIVALGLINVWLVRSSKSTGYRGGNAQTLRDEFKAYGLSNRMFQFVGASKIAIALMMIAGIWLPVLAQLSAYALIILMIGALYMHTKTHDPFKKFVPALIMLTLAIVIAGLLTF